MLALSERTPAKPKPQAGGASLVIQLARLGDFLQTTPLLAALGKPHVLVTPAQAPLALACRHRERVFIMDPATLEDAAGASESPRLRLARLGGLLEPLAGLAVGEVYNLNLSGLCAGLASLWPGAGVHGWRWQERRIAGEAWSPFLMNLVADRRLTRLHLSDILASYAAPQGPPLERLEHRVEPAARQKARELLPAGRPLAALQLGANNDLRRWPVASFALLAKGLWAQGVGLVLVGSGRERVLARRLLRELGEGGREARDLMGRTDLPTLAAVLEACDLTVSADTGSLHLATAVGSRVLALFMGPAQVHETGPYGHGHLVLQARDQCGPCQEHAPVCQGAAPCRRLISPQEALKAALALLGGASARRAAAGLSLPPGVEALAGEMDAFGQRYRPLQARPLSLGEGLAYSLREAGRLLLRPDYDFQADQVGRELAEGYSAPSQETRRQLAGLAGAAARLAAACHNGDADAARRVMAQAPGLKPLALTAGPQAPAGLSHACRAASAVLAMASQGGEGAAI